MYYVLTMVVSVGSGSLLHNQNTNMRKKEEREEDEVDSQAFYSCRD